MRNLKIKGIEKLPHPNADDIQTLEGWKILFGDLEEQEIEDTTQRINSSVERLRQTLQTII